MKKTFLAFFAFIMMNSYALACGWCYNSYLNCQTNVTIRWKLFMLSDMEFAYEVIGCNNSHMQCCLG